MKVKFTTDDKQMVLDMVNDKLRERQRFYVTSVIPLQNKKFTLDEIHRLEVLKEKVLKW